MRIALFNHKGGVGKTTLTVNIAAALARQVLRVLLVDSDPQCNITSYLVADDVVNDLLDSSDTADGATLWSAMKPVVEDGAIEKRIVPIESLVPGLQLLPGDIQLFRYERELAELWSECFQRKPRAYNGTTALSRLVNAIASALKFDYVFYDCGPNIGPLNRVILLDCDYFIEVAACDYFSIRALKTLG